MTAGVPGSGIGGSFYLLSALMMPVHESVALVRGTSSRHSRQAVVRQVVNAGGVLGGVWLTGWFIARSIATVSASLSISPAHQRMINLLSWANVVYGMVTLLAVFLFVQVLSVVMRRK